MSPCVPNVLTTYNPENIFLYEIEQIIKMDPAVIHFLDCREGVAFERLAEKECFTKVPDALPFRLSH